MRAKQLATELHLEEQRLEMLSELNESNLAAHQAKLNRLKALLDLKARQVTALDVRSPASGVIQAILVEVGEQVQAGSPLARLSDPNHLAARLQIPEREASRVGAGQPARVSISGRDIAALVDRLEPYAREGTVAVDLVFSEPVPEGVRPAQRVHGFIEVGRLSDVPYIPRPAGVEEGERLSLFRLQENGSSAERVPVELGAAAVEFIQVKSGLRESDRVILSNLSDWSDYARIATR